MKNENDKKLFSTRDLTLASVLVTLKFNLMTIDYQVEGNNYRPVAYFGFEETEDLKDAYNKYFKGLLAVEPKALMFNLRNLKAQITNAYKSPHSSFKQSQLDKKE
jgi:hypothetical protein